MIIILSQDKEQIIKCINVFINKHGNLWYICERNVTGVDFNDNESGSAYVLGAYATRERAKEVLQEIFESISFGSSTSKVSDYETYTNEPYYEMPQE